MKSKLCLTLLFASVLYVGSFAQKQETKEKHKNKMEQQLAMPPEQRAKEEASKAEKQLALSSDQKIRWEQAALTRITANKPFVEKLQGSTTPDERKELRSNIKKNGKEFDATVNAMLTPEQKTKWEGWKAEKRKKHGKENERKENG